MQVIFFILQQENLKNRSKSPQVTVLNQFYYFYCCCRRCCCFCCCFVAVVVAVVAVVVAAAVAVFVVNTKPTMTDNNRIYQIRPWQSAPPRVNW
jgi:hypothetical protein